MPKNAASASASTSVFAAAASRRASPASLAAARSPATRGRRPTPRRPPRGALPPPRAPIVHVGVQREGDAHRHAAQSRPASRAGARRRQEVPPRSSRLNPNFSARPCEKCCRARARRCPARARGSPGAGRRPGRPRGTPRGGRAFRTGPGTPRRAHSGRTSARDAGGARRSIAERAPRTSRGSRGAPHPRLACSAARRTAAMVREARGTARARWTRGGGGARARSPSSPAKVLGKTHPDAVSLPRGRSRPATCQRRSAPPTTPRATAAPVAAAATSSGAVFELAHHAAREAPSDVRSACVVSGC